ncbi:MAG: ABC transporter permease [Candidatus Pacearchaeota archaeon]
MAFSNVKHRGIRSWLTILGVFIGIAAVVSLISLSQGLQEAIIGQFRTLTGDNLIVQSSSSASYLGPPGSTAVRKLNEHDLDIIKSVSGVELAIPRLIRSVKIEYNGLSKFKYLTNLPENQQQIDYIYKTMDLEVSEGRLLKLGDKKKIVIGSNFIGKDEFGKPVKISSTLRLQNESFEVIGILSKTSNLQVNNAALLMEDDMKRILEIGDEIDMILVKTVSAQRTEEVAQSIEKKMRQDRDEKEGEEDFSVQTPLKALESISLILNIINLVVTGIAIISLFIGGIGIANTMYTSVLERKRDIGVMKAVGSTNFDILKIFIIESGLIGLIGGIIGALMGLAFAFALSFIANAYLGQTLLKVTISYPLIFAAISFSFLIGLLSGLSPAMQASKLRPVEALRS